MKIRQASRRDLHRITAIYNLEIKKSRSVYDYKQKTPEDRLEWFSAKLKRNLPVIVADQNGEVAGFGTYGSFRDKEAYQYTVEHSVYVAENMRGKGVGKLLLIELIETAKKEGFHSMIAGVDASNTGSIKFHKKMGFAEVGTFKEVGYKFDEWLDLTFLQLIL